MPVTFTDCWRRASLDTRGCFSPRKELIGSALVFILSGGVVLCWKGRVELGEVTLAAVTGSLGVALAWVLFFAFNLVLAPYRLERERADREQSRADAEKSRADKSTHAEAQPIDLLDFARMAEANFGWELFSGSASAGWQTWDLRSALEHAANAGIIKFEGKRFGIFSSPPDSPFLRRDELYREIERKDWLEQNLRIDVPGLQFSVPVANFDISILSTNSDDNTRYWDVRLTDRNAAAKWLEKEGAKYRGQSEAFYLREEAERKLRQRAEET